MATRSCYNVETVGATFVNAILLGDRKVAVQCFNEFTASLEADLLERLLVFVWLLSDPSHPQQGKRYKAYIDKNRKELLQSLLESPITVPPLTFQYSLESPKYGTRPPEPIWTKFPAGWTAEQAGTLWFALKDSLKRKNHQRATYLTVGFLRHNYESVKDLIQGLGVHPRFAELLTTVIYFPLLPRIVAHAFSSLVAEVAPFQTKPSESFRYRSFRVSPDSCATFGVPSPSVEQLVGAPVWITQEPTQYWLSLIGRNNVTVSSAGLEVPDETIDTFYKDGFPEDIPDEWSAEERAKSHGFVIPDSVNKNVWRAGFLLSF